MRKIHWLIAIPVLLATLAFGGTWVYIHVIAGDPPARLALADSTGTPSAGSTVAAAGNWTVTSGSQVGYRVGEVLFGQSATAVGRTSKVTGSLALDGATVSAAAFTVDMASVTSDESRRDGQFRNRIMSTGEFPTSTFTLTSPISLGSVPADGTTVTAKATGDLTLRGVTRRVTFEVKARRTGGRIDVNGTIPIVFDDWGIPSPSFGPAQVEDHGELEFLLVFTPA
jgi:polyisoprenoid-binding protein YceI